MKRILTVLTITACVLVALIVWADTQGVITNSSTTVPKELLDSAGNPFSARTFIFVGMSAAHTTNTSRVIIQRSSTNDTGGIPINPGEKVGIPVYTDRARPVQWWIDVESANDGVIIIPIQ